MSDWWTLTTSGDHEQGDLLFNLPVVTAAAIEMDGEVPSVHSRVERIDAIIVTQTCDLANAKIPTVLVARVVPWAAFAKAQFDAGNHAVKSRNYIDGLVRSDIPPLALLHERTTRPSLPWSLADFRELYTIERQRLEDFVAQPGSKRRLRLDPPYKEHFAQAFARFFMRVGLPHDAAGFHAAAKAQVANLI